MSLSFKNSHQLPALAPASYSGRSVRRLKTETTKCLWTSRHSTETLTHKSNTQSCMPNNDVHELLFLWELCVNINAAVL